MPGHKCFFSKGHIEQNISVFSYIYLMFCTHIDLHKHVRVEGLGTNYVEGSCNKNPLSTVITKKLHYKKACITIGQVKKHV